MDNGEILAEGNYEYLYSKYPEIFNKILKENKEEIKEDDIEEEEISK